MLEVKHFAMPSIPFHTLFQLTPNEQLGCHWNQDKQYTKVLFQQWIPGRNRKPILE